MGRFDLVTIDLDGTLIPGDTVFAAVLRAHGKAKEAAASDEAYFAGRITLEECFWQQWQWVQPQSLAAMHRALRNAAWMPGIGEGVRRLHAAGLRTALLTDQPSTLAEFAGRWGLDDPICSPVTVKDGRQVAIDARFDKLANLDRRLAELVAAGNPMPRERVCHVGNGFNDIPVFRAVGGSVAVFDNLEVQAAATTRLPAPREFGEVADAVLTLNE